MLLNNLAKRLNAQYLDTTSPYYPYFSKGNLCVKSLGADAQFIILRKRGYYTVCWIWVDCYQRGDLSLLHNMKEDLKETEVVKYLKYLCK